MARHFREQEIAEFRDCFQLYARSGQIRTAAELTVIMRSLRVSPTEPEIRAFLRAKNGVLSFADFLDCMHAQQRRERPAEEVRRALAASDSRRRGAIPVKELRHLLSGWGEKLSAREVDQILREANVKSSSGSVKHDDIIKVVSSPVPDYY